MVAILDKTDDENAALPAITVWTGRGEKLVLGGFQAGQNLLLYFMRSAHCPICRQHVARIAKLAPEIMALGSRILVVIPEGPEEAIQLQQALNLSFDVVTGVDGTVHAIFGLYRKAFGSIQQSGTLILDANNRVLMRHQAILPPLAFDLGKTLSALRRYAINAIDLPGRSP